MISEFNTTGIKTQYNGNYGLSLKVRYGEKPKLYFTGKSEVRIESPNDLDSFDIMEELMREQGRLTVMEEEPVLLLGTAGLSMPELRTFSKTFNLSAPRLENYGTFERISVNNLRIFPESLSEAKKWAWKLVLDGVDHYIGKNEYDELVKSTCGRFEPKYNSQDLVSGIPSYENVLKKAKSGDSEFKGQYWYLVAPSDLSPWREPQ